MFGLCAQIALDISDRLFPSAMQAEDILQLLLITSDHTTLA